MFLKIHSYHLNGSALNRIEFVKDFRTGKPELVATKLDNKN